MNLIEFFVENKINSLDDIPFSISEELEFKRTLESIVFRIDNVPTYDDETDTIKFADVRIKIKWKPDSQPRPYIIQSSNTLHDELNISPIWFCEPTIDRCFESIIDMIRSCKEYKNKMFCMCNAEYLYFNESGKIINSFLIKGGCSRRIRK